MWVVADLNDDYIAKMEDVLEVYERPYDPQEPVVCLDEKPVTLHADVRPTSPAVPGREARRDNEYERRGTANVFCAVEPKAGRHYTFATPDRSGFEFAQVAVALALAYPEAKTIHLVYCHGGDRNEDDGNLSMSAGRGFKVRVTREDAPEYCGRCHSDAAYIGKYKPGQRTDQVALYRKCVHGEQLAKGNNKTANCIDCHGIHNIRAADDPQSPVHPSRLAGKCGACHGEIAKMFQQSPHARVFTTSGMAGCSVCHSSHGTERAGVEMFTGAKPVCARCHAASSAGGHAAASMAAKIAGLAPADRGAAAREAAHALRLAP